MKCAVHHKVKYATHKEAEQAKIDWCAKRKEIFGSYACPSCNSWHLTSMYDNRTQTTKEACKKLQKPRKKELRRKRVETGLRGPIRATTGCAKRTREEKALTVTLSQEEMKKALAQIHNKPAGLFLRIKDIIRKSLSAYRGDTLPSKKIGL